MSKNAKIKPSAKIGTLINELIDLKLRLGKDKDFEAVIYSHQRIGQITEELNLRECPPDNIIVRRPLKRKK